MNIKKTITYHIDEIDDVVKQLEQLLKHCKIITFTGPLGAGKTTLIQLLLRAQDIAEPITSPTFTYVNVYKNQSNQTFYHFDLYRIEKLQDFVSSGFDEYLYQPGSWALIEWPEVIMPLLDHDVCHVTIAYDEEPEKRILQIKCTN